MPVLTNYAAEEHRDMGNAYPGSKAAAGLCRALISLMPPHSACIESHLGGGAIMKRKLAGAAQHRHRPGCPGDRGA